MGLFKKFVTVASGTFASRVFGFCREILMATALGTGPVADAFNAAFRFPNSFRRLFAEGALTTAFVPIFAKKIEENGLKDARAFAANVFGILLSVLIILTIIAQIFMPYIVRYFIAPGFISDQYKYITTVRFAFIMFPYLACMSLTAIISGMLNSMRHYLASSLAPVLLNLILISILAYSYHAQLNYWRIGFYLAYGVLFAGFMQLLLVYFAAYRLHIDVKFKLPHLNKEIRQMLLLALPAAISGGITQINLLINTAIASTNSGAISSLVYADRLYQLPLAIIGISIGTVLLPELSRALRAENKTQAINLQQRSIELSFMLALPAAAALIYIGEPIVRLLLEHGHFGEDSTKRVANLLTIYGLGLPSFILVKALLPNYFARQDTKTPLLLACVAVLINISLALSLFPHLSAKGIAIAEITASWANSLSLMAILLYKKHLSLNSKLILRLGKFLLASFVLAIATHFLANYYSFNLSHYSSLGLRITTNLAIIIFAIMLYFAILIALKAFNLKEIIKESLGK